MTAPQEPPPPPTTVTGIRITGPRGERAQVTLEDGSELRLDAETVLSTGLRTGDPVDAQLRATLVEAGVRWEAREAALRLLSHRARSRREVEQRLRKKGFAPGVVSDTADQLVRLGYLDDAAFARAFVADRLRLRPRGRRALAAELRKKGVASSHIDAALDEAFREEGTSERAIARELAEGWLRRQGAPLRRALLGRERTPDGEKALRRFQGFLSRRGIAGGLALQVLEEFRTGEG